MLLFKTAPNFGQCNNSYKRRGLPMVATNTNLKWLGPFIIGIVDFFFGLDIE